MKKGLFAIALILSLSACATSTATSGRDFSSANVQQIEKGETTTQDLQRLFGQPFSKTVINKDQEKWIYMFSNTSATATSYVFSMKVDTTGSYKTLDVLIENGVVVNHTFTESDQPYLQMNSY